MQKVCNFYFGLAYQPQNEYTCKDYFQLQLGMSNNQSIAGAYLRLKASLKAEA